MSKIMPLAAVAVLCFTASSLIAQETPSSNVYIIPDDASCTVRKEDRVTFCTDKEGNPITGELRKYRERELIRTYPLENGILNGTAMSYYINSGVLSEKPYVNGKLHGLVKTYYKNGKTESITPYTNGAKEGVAKSYYENGYMQAQGIFIGNSLNGASRMYDERGEFVYELTYQNNTIISGYCMYKTEPDNGKYYKKALAPQVIQMINSKKIAPKPIIIANKCAMEKMAE